MDISHNKQCFPNYCYSETIAEEGWRNRQESESGGEKRSGEDCSSIEFHDRCKRVGYTVKWRDRPWVRDGETGRGERGGTSE